MGYETAEIRMMREPLNITPPLNILERDKKLFIHHFKTRAELEEKNFPTHKEYKSVNQADLLKVSSLELNSHICLDFIRKFAPNFCIIFGTELIKDSLLKSLPDNTFNLHLGISPWYRGAATLFWPFYMLQPQFAGTTIHKITNKPDAGKIYHQEVPNLYSGQGIHDVAIAAVKATIKPLKQLITVIEKKPNIDGFEPSSTGRLWREKDFRPEHLRLVYEQFNDNIVDKYLSGELGGDSVKLLSIL